MLKQTPNQTVGPFFQDGLLRGGENVLVDAQTSGEKICVTGRVLDGEGRPVVDALVEIWQADARGHFNHPVDPDPSQADAHFRGFGRSDTIQDGRFWFQTVKPDRVPGRDGKMQAPHIDVRVFARGMLIHVLTRLYFADENENANDVVLNSINDPTRRRSLIAVLESSGDLPTYRFDIRLQGECETVFFEP